MVDVAVVGATGAVGRECLSIIDKGLSAAVDRVFPVASTASLGRDLADEFGLTIKLEPVVTIDQLDPASVDVAVFCAGVAVSGRDAERIARAGALVVDNSSAFRMRPDVPLVVPQVNPRALAERPAANLVANPNCSTIQLVRALHPLHELAGLDEVVVASYQAASGGGIRGLREVADGSARVLAHPDHVGAPGGRFGHPLPFNLVPQIGPVDDDGQSHEEQKLRHEPRKILGLPRLRVTATAVRVPVFNCHSEAVRVRLTRPVSVAEVEDALAATPGLRLYRPHDDPPYPMPRTIGRSDADRTLVHVGRVRADPEDTRSVWLWVVADNLWVGAALNALEIVRLSMLQGWL